MLQHCLNICSLRKHSADRCHHCIPREMTSIKGTRKNFYTDDVSLLYPDVDSASNWLKQIFNQSETLPPSGYSDASSVWNICSFFGRHFAGIPAVASRNVGFFLRLVHLKTFNFALPCVIPLCLLFSDPHGLLPMAATRPTSTDKREAFLRRI